MKTSLLYIVLYCLIALSISACAKLPDNFGNKTTFAITQPGETTLGKLWEGQFSDHPGESAFLPLDNGLDAFSARAILAYHAEKTIDAQYYLLHNDTVGALFIDMLYQAANRGVRVRLLLDDMDLEGRDFDLSVLDGHDNIEVRIFNPFGRNTGRIYQFLTGFGQQTRRSHNKSFTVDNIATIVGGRNIGNEYFVADPTLAFLDLDVLGLGPVAQEVSGSFDQYWNDPLSYPVRLLADKIPTTEESDAIITDFNDFIDEQRDSIYLKNLKESNLVHSILGRNLRFIWGASAIVADAPDKLRTSVDDDTYHLSKKLAPYLENIEKELLIISPYFIPGDAGVAYFRDLHERGVSVKVLTNSLSSTDVPIVHSGYAKYRRALLKIGVELYELNKNFNEDEQKNQKNSKFYLSKSSLHAKAFVIDGRHVFIGSLNLDPRSVIQNTEIGVIFEAKELAEDFSQSFDENMKKGAFKIGLRKGKDGHERMVWSGIVDGEDIELFAEPYTSFWERFSAGFLRLIPAESQL